MLILRDAKEAVILIDEADFSSVGDRRWNVAMRPDGSRYATRCDGRTTVYMHRLLCGGQQVDHANRRGFDNRRGNLRPATQSQNNANQGARDSASGYRGVYWEPKTKNFAARIWANGRSRRLGRFASPEEAARAYDTAALEVFGPFATLNFKEGR